MSYEVQRTQFFQIASLIYLLSPSPAVIVLKQNWVK